MKLLIKLAFKNILNYSKQSKSTLLSISAAFISLVLFQGYIKDVDLVIQDEYSRRSMLGDFLIENKVSLSPEAKKEPWKYYLTVSDQKQIKDLTKKFFKKETPLCSVLRISGMIQKKSQQFLFVGNGFDVDECRKLRLPHWEKDVLYGDAFFQRKERDVLLLGQTLAKNFDCVKANTGKKFVHMPNGYGDQRREYNCNNGDQFSVSVLTVHSQINSLDFSMIGIVDGGFIDIDARLLQMPLEKAQELYDTKDVSYMSFFSAELLNNKDLFDQFSAALPDHLRIVSWKQHEDIGDFYRRAMDLMNLLKVFVVIIVLVIVSLSIMNSLLKSIKERTKEIGTMRSLGYPTGVIRNIFFIEVAFLALFGSFIGAIFSVVATVIINSSGISYKAGQFVESTPMTIAFDPLNYLLVTGYIFILSVIGCYFVIKGTLKQTVAENFNHA